MPDIRMILDKTPLNVSSFNCADELNDRKSNSRSFGMSATLLDNGKMSLIPVIPSANVKAMKIVPGHVSRIVFFVENESSDAEFLIMGKKGQVFSVLLSVPVSSQSDVVAFRTFIEEFSVPFSIEVTERIFPNNYDIFPDDIEEESLVVEEDDLLFDVERAGASDSSQDIFEIDVTEDEDLSRREETNSLRVPLSLPSIDVPSDESLFKTSEIKSVVDENDSLENLETDLESKRSNIRSICNDALDQIQKARTEVQTKHQEYRENETPEFLIEDQPIELLAQDETPVEEKTTKELFQKVMVDSNQLKSEIDAFSDDIWAVPSAFSPESPLDSGESLSVLTDKLACGNEAMRRLTKEIKGERLSRKKIEAQLDETRKKYEESLANNDSLKSALALANERQKEADDFVKEAVKEHHRILAETEQKITTVNEEINKALIRAESAEKAKIEAEEELSNEKKKFSKKTHELEKIKEDLNRKIEEAEEEKQKANDALTEAETSLSSFTQEIMEQVSQEHEELQNCQQQLLTTKRLLEDEENRTAALNAQLNEKTETIREMKEQIGAFKQNLESSIAAANQRFKEEMNESERLYGSIIDSEIDKREDLETEIKNLRAENVRLSSIAAEVENVHDKAKTAIDASNVRSKEFETSLIEQSRAYNDLSSSISDLLKGTDNFWVRKKKLNAIKAGLRNLMDKTSSVEVSSIDATVKRQVIEIPMDFAMVNEQTNSVGYDVKPSMKIANADDLEEFDFDEIEDLPNEDDYRELFVDDDDDDENVLNDVLIDGMKNNFEDEENEEEDEEKNK